MTRPALLARVLTISLLAAAATACDALVTDEVKQARLIVLEHPADGKAWMNLADVCRRADRGQEAHKALEIAHRISSDPRVAEATWTVPPLRSLSSLERKALREGTDDEVWGDLGDEARDRGRSDLSIQYYTLAFALDPSDSEWKGHLMSATGSPQVDEVLAQLALAYHNDDERLGDLGDFHSERGEADRARELYRRALEVDPGDEEWSGKLTALGGHAEVDVIVSDSLMTSTNDEAIGDMADGLWTSGQLTEACAAYRRAAALDPDDSEWRTKTTRCTAAESTSIEGVRASIMTNTNDEEVGDLADGLWAAGRTDAACEAYQRAAILDPADSEWRTALTRCGTGSSEGLADAILASGNDESIGDLADGMWAAGRHQEACDAYRRASQLDPDDSEWRTALTRCAGFAGATDAPQPRSEGSDLIVTAATTLVAKAGPAESAEFVHEAMMAHPDNQPLRLLAQNVTGRSEVDLMQELVAANPNSDELVGDLGDALLRAGRASEAVEAYGRAASLDPSDSEWPTKREVAESLIR